MTESKQPIFSERNPSLRTVWDATCLSAFMLDPLTYYWKYVEGWRSREPSVDLLWGTAWDKAIGHYHWLRGRAVPREAALEQCIYNAIDRAKEVNLDAVAAESKKPKHKNIMTLIRGIVWYDAEFGDYDLFTPASNEPTVVKLKLDIKTPYGENYWVVGNFDQVVINEENGKKLVLERKTTTQTIGKYFWEQYDPSVQLNTYDWLAHEQFGTAGVWVEGCQTAVGFTRFAHHEVYRTPMQRQHWRQVVEWWIKTAERVAVDDAWAFAMNVAGQKWESVTRNIERRTPAVWDGLLGVDLEKREPWNPLEID